MPDPTWADFVGGWPIFRDPVLCGALAGAALGLLGVYVVLRRMVFMAAVLSQSAGFGVALAIWLGMLADARVEPMIGAIVAALGASALFSLRPERVHLSREALLAVAWVAAGAGALVLGGKISAEAHDIESILFGSAVLVRPVDLWLVGAAAVLTVGAHAWLGRGLVFAGFDPQVARVHGLPVAALDLGLWVLVAVVVSVSTRALGALPVLAFSVLPAMAALLLVPRLSLVFPAAAGIGAVSGGLGYLLAFFESWPVGASQSLVAVGFVLVAALVRAVVWR
jgi:zinc transport system permease protein